MTRRETAIAIVVSLFVGPSVSWGAPVLNPANGHYYDLVLHFANMSWVQVMLEANGLNYLGTPGHLATITSQAENDFLANNVVSQRQYGCFYTGGYKSVSAWYWMTGEPWSYANWKSGEPSSGENYVAFIANPPPDAYGKWNNINSMTEPNVGYVAHYIVEYDVPEPATVSLLLLGGLAACRRRARG